MRRRRGGYWHSWTPAFDLDESHRSTTRLISPIAEFHLAFPYPTDTSGTHVRAIGYPPWNPFLIQKWSRHYIHFLFGQPSNICDRGGEF